MNGCIVRQADQADAPAIASLVSQLGYPATSEDVGHRLDLILALPEYVTFVADAEGEVVGLMNAYMGYSLEFSGMFGRITLLVVDEEWRGQGIGRLLMEKAEAWLAEQGALLVVLTSSSRRTDTHGFYKHIGYLDTGVRFTKKLPRR